MEFLKCPDVRWKGPEKRNKANVVATTVKQPASRSQISRYGWMQPTHMRSVTFLGKFTSGSRISASRISASRSDLLKLPTVWTAAVSPSHLSSICLQLVISLLLACDKLGPDPFIAAPPDITEVSTVVALWSPWFRSLFSWHCSLTVCSDHFYLWNLPSRAIASMLYQYKSGRLDSKCTTRSSSDIKSSITDN